MSFTPLSRTGLRFAALALVLIAGACSSTFRTDYDAPVSSQVSRNWHVADIAILFPSDITVSEARTLRPSADIVWREDPAGDRKPQVARIVADAAQAATISLQGAQAVRLELTVTRFHALTFEAETKLKNAGVHNIDLIARVTDIATGEVLAGPDVIEAALPALAGPQMAEARARGESQKMHISNHLRRVIAGWLGVGPDPRGSFTRLGV